MNTISSDIKIIMEQINSVAEEYLLPEPYIVGGYVRNLYLGAQSLDDDIDITTNSGDNSLFLGILYSKKNNCNIQIFKERHSSVYSMGKKIDFSSGFISSKIPADSPEYLKETLSRDFTIDSLHISCKDLSIYDFSGRGLSDLKSKTLDTLIDPIDAFSDDPKRVFRAVYLASRHNLNISERIIDCCKNIDIEDFRKENLSFITSTIEKSFSYSFDDTIKNINKLSLDGKIPMFGKYRDYLIQSGDIKKYLEI